jgi:hypothetical protein
METLEATEIQVLTERTMPLEIIMGTVLRHEAVKLKHSLKSYLRGAYLCRSKLFEGASGIPFPFPLDRVLGLHGVTVWGQSRDPHTVVVVTAMDGLDPVQGVGFAKRAFDEPRIERGTALALDRALDDLVCLMGRRAFDRVVER